MYGLYNIVQRSYIMENIPVRPSLSKIMSCSKIPSKFFLLQRFLCFQPPPAALQGKYILKGHTWSSELKNNIPHLKNSHIKQTWNTSKCIDIDDGKCFVWFQRNPQTLDFSCDYISKGPFKPIIKYSIYRLIFIILYPRE